MNNESSKSEKNSEEEALMNEASEGIETLKDQDQIPSTSTSNSTSDKRKSDYDKDDGLQKKSNVKITDLRPRPIRVQGWDAWRPGPYGPPTPPSMEKRLAEENALEMAAMMGHGRQDGRARKIRPRRTVDVGGSMSRWTLMRSLRTCPDEHYFIRPCIDHLIEFLPPQAYSLNPSTSILTKYVHTSTNKIRCPINIVRFTPDARRVLTGATSGEFTLWNGLTFNFETILQAHDTAVRAADWSKSGAWLVSGDNSGIIKYFQPNMNNLQMFEGHKDSVRDISFSPSDSRFASCGDDGVIKLWGFEERREERSLTGHGWDVKCVKWHPTKGLLCSGGKDSLVKFWDPRIGKCLTTLHGHKNSVQACAWNPNGHTVATASRDQMIKVFEIRMMKELANLRGHKKEVCSLAWHPVHHELLTSGGSDGSIFHWFLPDSNPVDSLDFAHDGSVWSLDYHPLGHTLVSGSNDHTTRFWSRGRPGVKIAHDRFHIGKEKAREMGVKDEDEPVEDFFVPGLGNQFGPSTTGSIFPFNAFGGVSLKDPTHTQNESTTQMLSKFTPPSGFGVGPNTNGSAGLMRIPSNQRQAGELNNPMIPNLNEIASIPGFGRAVDVSDNSLPGLTNVRMNSVNSNNSVNPSSSNSTPVSGWRRGPLPSQEVAMGRDFGGAGGGAGLNIFSSASNQTNNNQIGGKNRWRTNTNVSSNSSNNTNSQKNYNHNHNNSDNTLHPSRRMHVLNHNNNNNNSNFGMHMMNMMSNNNSNNNNNNNNNNSNNNNNQVDEFGREINQSNNNNNNYMFNQFQ